MRTVTAVLAFLLAMSTARAQDCVPPGLSHEAFVLVRPYMERRITQVAAENTPEGTWRGMSRYAPEADRRFYSIIEDRSGAGASAGQPVLRLAGIG